MLHEIHCPELSEEIVSSLDNAALWAYKVGKEALNQADLFSNQQCLEQMGLIVGVSSAGTEAFLPLFEQRVEDFSLRKSSFSQAAFSSCCSSASTLLGLKGGVELVATACTASPNAVGMAFDYIQNGKKQGDVSDRNGAYLSAYLRWILCPECYASAIMLAIFRAIWDVDWRRGRRRCTGRVRACGCSWRDHFWRNSLMQHLAMPIMKPGLTQEPMAQCRLCRKQWRMQGCNLSILITSMRMAQALKPMIK